MYVGVAAHTGEGLTGTRPVAGGRQRRGRGNRGLARIGQAVEHERIVRPDGVACEDPDAIGRLLVLKRNTASPDCCVPPRTAGRLIARKIHRDRIRRRILRARRDGALDAQPPMRPDSAPRADTVITQLPPNTPVPR